MDKAVDFHFITDFQGGEKCFSPPFRIRVLLSTETEEQKKRGRPGNEATSGAQDIAFISSLTSTFRLNYFTVDYNTTTSIWIGICNYYGNIHCKQKQGKRKRSLGA